LTLAELLEVLGLLSLLTFVGSLIVIPWLVLRMHAEYFIRHRQEVIERHKRHPVLTIIILLIRNSFGFFLLASGVIMLLLPGQGILTMVIGLSLMDFPGKHRLTDRVMRNKELQHSLNWIRRKGHKKELVF
jgi:hypothetical protein